MMFVRLNVLINFVHFSAQVKFINGKETGCRLAMKAVMNVEAAESVAQQKILNGNIQKVVTELFSDLHRKKVLFAQMSWQHFLVIYFKRDEKLKTFTSGLGECFKFFIRNYQLFLHYYYMYVFSQLYLKKVKQKEIYLESS
jgi:hypothetical protein